MYKSMIAILLGGIVSFVLAALFGVLMSATPLVFWLSNFYGAIILIAIGATMGGWMTSKLAPFSPLKHALILGVINGFLSAQLSARSSNETLLFLAGLIFTIVGGWLGQSNTPYTILIKEEDHKWH